MIYFNLFYWLIIFAIISIANILIFINILNKGLMSAWIAIPASIFGLIFLVLPFVPQPRFSASNSTTISLNIISVLVISVGLFLAICAKIVFMKHSTSLIPETPSLIVNKGIYGIVRHPIYVAVLLIYFGIYLLMKGIWSLCLIFPLIVATLFGRAHIEEKILEKEIPEYKTYKKKVGMFFPRVWKE
jgi:protein-S-isoprenylcysteine O-methyltransferase Ste14